jgi:hypothetical protein
MPIQHQTENELLLCCARTRMDQEKIDRGHTLLRKGIDWPFLESMARLHGLAPLLYKNIDAHFSADVPPLILHQLQERYVANARRNLLLVGQLLMLLRLFKDHDIQVIPYKGPVLAASAHGDITLREFHDLDFLVQQDHLLRARDLLLSRGYQLSVKSDCGDVVRQNSQYEVGLVLAHAGIHVELKWDIIDRYFALPMDTADLWTRLKPVFIDGRKIHTFSPEDTLLILCIHGTKHLWASLMWVTDVSELIQANPGLDWQWLLDLSNSLGSRRMLFLGLLLAKGLLGTSLPLKVKQQVEADSSVKRLAEEVSRRLFDQSDQLSSAWEKVAFHCRARERLGDRAKYGCRLVLTTTPSDRALLAASSSLSALSPYIRPFRLAGKYGKSLAKRLLTTVNTL